MLFRYRMECTCRIALNAQHLMLHGVSIVAIAPRLCMSDVRCVALSGED